MKYDAFGRSEETLTAEGVRKKYAYDLNDNKLSEGTEVSSGTWTRTAYEYDVLDKPVTVSLEISDGRTATGTSSYDGNGNVSSTFGADEVLKTVEYDAQDRPVKWTERPRWRTVTLS